MNQYILKNFTILILLSGIFFFFGNGLFHLTDPDEVFYALSAKEMILKNEWLTPYIFGQPQFEKPILTYWLLKMAMLFFGDNAFAIRFFPALFAILGVIGVYVLGMIGFISERRAFLAAFVMSTSIFYLAMGKSVFTDMIFSVFILYALLSFIVAYIYPKYKGIGFLGFYCFAALATLTKGPLGLIIPLMSSVVFLAYVKQMRFLLSPWMLVGLMAYFLVAAPWYWYEFSTYGQNFIREFFYNDHWRRLIEAEHKSNDRWFFYPLTMLAGLFPWGLFLIAVGVDLYKRLKYGLKFFEYFLFAWVVVVLFIFQIAHSKLASYILPMFPALALLVANYIDGRIEDLRTVNVKKISYVTSSFLILIGVAVLAAYRYYEVYIPSSMPAYFLSAGLISIGGVGLVLLLKDKIRAGLFLMGFSLIPIFLTGFLVSGYIEPYTSMAEAVSYLPAIKKEKTRILVSKPYARGVRYFTDLDTVVMDINGGNYFSPHPIDILTSNQMLVEFLNTQEETFAIIKKSQYKDLLEQCSQFAQVDILKVSGPNYVLRIKSNKNA